MVRTDHSPCHPAHSRFSKPPVSTTHRCSSSGKWSCLDALPGNLNPQLEHIGMGRYAGRVMRLAWFAKAMIDRTGIRLPSSPRTGEGCVHRTKAL